MHTEFVLWLGKASLSNRTSALSLKVRSLSNQLLWIANFKLRITTLRLRLTAPLSDQLFYRKLVWCKWKSLKQFKKPSLIYCVRLWSLYALLFIPQIGFCHQWAAGRINGTSTRYTCSVSCIGLYTLEFYRKEVRLVAL